MRTALAALCLGLALSLVAHDAALAAEPLKVAFVYVDPVGDSGWTYQHDLGRQAWKRRSAPQIKTTYVESVAEGADAERVIRQLAAGGNHLIFTTSFGYMEPTLKVAKQFPKVHFEHATGYKTAANVVGLRGALLRRRVPAGRGRRQDDQDQHAGFRRLISRFRK